MDLKFIIKKLGIQDRVTEEAMLDMLKDEGIVTTKNRVNAEYKDCFSKKWFKIKVRAKGILTIVKLLKERGIEIYNSNLNSEDQFISLMEAANIRLTYDVDKMDKEIKVMDIVGKILIGIYFIILTIVTVKIFI